MGNIARGSSVVQRKLSVAIGVLSLLDNAVNHKQVKACTGYARALTREGSRGQIQHSASPRAVFASRPAPSAINPVFHSKRYIN